MSEEHVYKVQDDGSSEEVERQTEGRVGSRVRQPVDGRLIIGGFLILVGIMLLVERVLGIELFRIVRGLVWPFYVFVPGVVLLILGFVTGAAGEGLLIAGSIVSTVGLLLFYQNLTGHWTSWAYAWALVAPTSVGVGQIIYGALRGNQKKVRDGLSAIMVGGGLFVAGAVFFELVLGISGFRLRIGRIALPILLIGLGVISLLRTLLFRRREG